MSQDDKDDQLESLDQVKYISQLYQASKLNPHEMPTKKIDKSILALAKERVKHDDFLAGKTNARDKKRSKWRPYLSLAASVCLVSLVFITQRQYFIDPPKTLIADNPLEPEMMRMASQSKETRSEEIQHDDTQDDEQPETIVLEPSSNLLTDRRGMVSSGKSSLADTQSVPRQEFLVKQKKQQVEKRKKRLVDPLFEIDKVAKQLQSETAKDSKHDRFVAPLTTENTAVLQTLLFDKLFQYKLDHPESVIGNEYYQLLTEQQTNQLLSINKENKPKTKKDIK
jgi:hypothetical protein